MKDETRKRDAQYGRNLLKKAGVTTKSREKQEIHKIEMLHNILKLFMAPHSFAIFKRAVCLHGYLTLTTHSRGFHILHLDDLAMPTLRDKWFCAPLLIKDADFGFTGGRGWNRE